MMYDYDGAYPHRQAGTPDLRRLLLTVVAFLIFHSTLYTMNGLNVDGFTVLIELEDTSAEAVGQLRQALACLQGSQGVNTRNVQVVVFCSCGAPADMGPLNAAWAAATALPAAAHAALGAATPRHAGAYGGFGRAHRLRVTWQFDWAGSYLHLVRSHAIYRFIGFLPADVCVDPMWLAGVWKHLLRGAEVVGSRVLAADGTLEHASVRYQIGPYRAGNAPLPAFYLRGMQGNDSRATRDRHVVSVSKVGMATSQVWFIIAAGFNDTMAPHYDALSFSLHTVERGGVVYYCGTCVVRRSSTSQQLMEYHAVRESLTSQAQAFVETWGDVLTRALQQQRRSAAVVQWVASVTSLTGFASEAVTTLMEIEQYVFVKLLLVDDALLSPDLRTAGLPAWVEETLTRMADRAVPRGGVQVLVGAAEHLSLLPRRPPTASVVVRAAGDTDRVPASLAAALRSADEVWVPSAFHARVFTEANTSAGLRAEQVRIYPPFVDTRLWDPATASPYEHPAALLSYTARAANPAAAAAMHAPWAGFVFLSVFEWSDRKGWQDLLQAYAEEFGCCPSCEDVQLVLKVTFPPAAMDEFLQPADGDHHADLSLLAARFARQYLAAHAPPQCTGPRVDVVARRLDPADLLRLYRTASAFVLPSHGEGLGQAYLEAMAMELPIIATNWSIATHLLDNTTAVLLAPELVDVPPGAKGLPPEPGHRYANVRLADLRAAMRSVFGKREAAKQMGRRARARAAQQFSSELIPKEFVGRLRNAVGSGLRTRLANERKAEDAVLAELSAARRGRVDAGGGGGQDPLRATNAALRPAVGG